jgi:hypothetical protein
VRALAREAGDGRGEGIAPAPSHERVIPSRHGNDDVLANSEGVIKTIRRTIVTALD